MIALICVNLFQHHPLPNHDKAMQQIPDNQLQTRIRMAMLIRREIPRHLLVVRSISDSCQCIVCCRSKWPAIVFKLDRENFCGCRCLHSIVRRALYSGCCLIYRFYFEPHMSRKESFKVSFQVSLYCVAEPLGSIFSKKKPIMKRPVIISCDQITLKLSNCKFSLG